jgi:hypothetical protein
MEIIDDGIDRQQQLSYWIFFRFKLSSSAFQSSIPILMAKKATKRVYLSDEEKTVLASLLEEWNSKPDKKTRDGYITAEALPKIQQLNIAKFGPDVISKDKAAKILWDDRVQVCFLPI